MGWRRRSRLRKTSARRFGNRSGRSCLRLDVVSVCGLPSCECLTEFMHGFGVVKGRRIYLNSMKHDTEGAEGTYFIDTLVGRGAETQS